VTPAGPLRLAHRGDWRRAPENSVEAFVAAMAIPVCDGVEFDVRLSRDGVPILLHDETLARVQRRPERAVDLEAVALGRLGVPSLEDALGVLPDHAFVDVELKAGDDWGTTAIVLRVARGDAPATGVVSSFHDRPLGAMRDLLPGWPRWLNADDLSPSTVERALALGCSGISAPWGAITPPAMRRATDEGLVVAGWTVRRRDTFDRLGRLGVVACCVEGAALDGRP
jgi:glycerophosphoryl diester phosphodiesterase